MPVVKYQPGNTARRLFGSSSVEVKSRLWLSRRMRHGIARVGVARSPKLGHSGGVAVDAVRGEAAWRYLEPRVSRDGIREEVHQCPAINSAPCQPVNSRQLVIGVL